MKLREGRDYQPCFSNTVQVYHVQRLVKNCIWASAFCSCLTEERLSNLAATTHPPRLLSYSLYKKTSGHCASEGKEKMVHTLSQTPWATVYNRLYYKICSRHIDHRVVSCIMVNYQFVHRQKYRHCSPGRRCGEDFPQGTGRPPPDLDTHNTQAKNTLNWTVWHFSNTKM